jgi:hypothetical protein
MKEYIEREAVMQEFADYVWNSNHSDLVPAPTWNHAVDIVRDIPTADVVEVVRCKDCRYYTDAKFNVFSENDMVCAYAVDFHYYREPDDYCSKGVRKGGEPQ